MENNFMKPHNLKFIGGVIMKKIIIFIKTLIYLDCFPGPARKTGVLFIHIPKAAGSSISLGLYNMQIGHIPAKTYFLSNPKLFREMKTFTVVREPIIRFVSAYDFICSGGMTPGDKVNFDTYISKYSDINAFVASLTVDFINSGKILHLLPQNYFVYLKGNCLVNYIYKLELLNRDEIQNDLGISWEIDLKNKTKFNSKVILTDESREKLKLLYERDYYLFGYNL
jgi:hypothetical protein